MTQEGYEYYLSHIYRTKSGLLLSPSSVRHYVGESLRFINNLIPTVSDGRYDSIYEIDDIEELRRIRNGLMDNEAFSSTNSRGNNMYSSALNRYMEFAEGVQFSGRRECLVDIPERPTRKTTISERTQPGRSRIKVLQAEMANSFTCEINPTHRTFIAAATNHSYCEGHHLIPLSKQDDYEYSLDCFANIIVLCPTCHRMFHYARQSDIEKHLYGIFEEREERYHSAGLNLTRPEFLEAATSRPSGRKVFSF